MKFLSFFALALGFAQAQVTPNVEPVDYADAYDNDFPLLGYVSIPESETPVPAVVIIVSVVVDICYLSRPALIHWHRVCRFLTIDSLFLCKLYFYY